MPQYAPLRSLRGSRESLRCCLACRLCHGSRAKRDRMVPSHNNDHKHTDTRHPLPDFSLHNTCKFALPAAAWITALAMGATQKDARVLTHLFPPGLWSTACDILVAEHGIRSVKIPIEGSPVVGPSPGVQSCRGLWHVLGGNSPVRHQKSRTQTGTAYEQTGQLPSLLADGSPPAELRRVGW